MATTLTYQYDTTAELAANKFKVTLDINNYPNKWNVVVPPAAPFYRKSLTVTTEDGTILTEGMDYYLAYYFSNGSEATGKALFGGIIPIGFERIVVEANTCGGNHLIPKGQITKILTDDDIANPRNTLWEDIQVFPTVVVPVSKPETMDAALEDDEIVKAIDMLAKNKNAKLTDDAAAYTSTDTTIDGVIKRFESENYRQHHLNHNDHPYTTDTVGALPEAATAVDSVLSYQLELDDFTNLLKHFGISTAQVNALFNKSGNQTVKGPIQVIDDSKALVFKDSTGKASLTLHSGDANLFELTGSNGEILIEGNTDDDGQDLGVEIGAGINRLIVGANSEPHFNSHTLIPTDKILNYLFKPGSETISASVTSTATVELFGQGTSNAPIFGNVVAPTATATVMGLWKITSTIGYTGTGFVISQKAITSLRDTINKYVNKTITLNGKTISGAVVITKADIGLGNVNNTAPSAKPVTAALKTAMANKSLVGHTHSKSDLTDTPTASGTQYGISKYTSTVSATGNIAITPAAVNDILDPVADAMAEIDSRVPDGLMDIIRYGDRNYLPIPVQGNYNGAGDVSEVQRCAAMMESDTSLVLIHTGGDLESIGCYYSIGTIGTKYLTSITPTTTKYAPSFVGDEDVYESFTATNDCFVISACEDILNDRNTKNYYIVLAYGTMNYAKHKGAKISNFSEVCGNSKYHFVLKYGNYIYLIYYNTSISSGGYMAVRVSRCLISDIESNDSVEFDIVPLSATDFYGDTNSGNDVHMFNKSVSTTFDDKPMILHNGTMTGVNANLQGISAAMRHDGGSTVKLAFGDFLRGYYNGGYPGAWWMFSVTLDLDSLTVVADGLTDKTVPAITIGSTNACSGELVKGNINAVAFGSSWAMRGNSVYQKGLWVNVIKYGGGPIYVTTTNLNIDAAGLSGYLINDASVVSNSEVGMRQLVPAYGTPITSGLRMLSYIGGNKVSVFCAATNQYLVSDLSTDVRSYNSWSAGVIDGLDLPSNSIYKNPTSLDRAIVPYFKESTGLDDPSIAGVTLNYGLTTAYSGYNSTGNKVSCASSILKTLVDNILASRTLVSVDKITNSAVSIIVPYNDNHPVLVNVCYLAKNESNGFSNAYQSISLWDVDNHQGAITSFSNERKVFDGLVANNRTTTLSVPMTTLKNSAMIEFEDGTIGYMGLQAPYGGNVGWASSIPCSVVYNPSTDTVEGYRHWVMLPTANYNDSGYGVYPVYGICTLSNDSSTTTVLGSSLGFSKDFLAGNSASATGKVVLFSGLAPSGSMIYITQEIPFYIKKNLYTLPVTSWDLDDEFGAGKWYNSTYYIYACIVEGAASYIISASKIADTSSLVLVGTVTTGDNIINDIQVERVTRLGNVALLAEHAQNRKAHDYDPTEVLANVPLRIMDNVGMVHEVVDLTDDEKEEYASEQTIVNSLSEASGKSGYKSGSFSVVGSTSWMTTKNRCELLLPNVANYGTAGWKTVSGATSIALEAGWTGSTNQYIDVKKIVYFPTANTIFKYCVDNILNMWIDGTNVISDGVTNNAIASVTLSSISAGWHSIVIRIQESLGGSVAYANFGFFNGSATTPFEFSDTSWKMYDPNGTTALTNLYPVTYFIPYGCVDSFSLTPRDPDGDTLPVEAYDPVYVINDWKAAVAADSSVTVGTGIAINCWGSTLSATTRTEWLPDDKNKAYYAQGGKWIARKQFTLSTAGTVTFTFKSDDGGNLYVNGVRKLTSAGTVDVSLAEGTHTVSIYVTDGPSLTYCAANVVDASGNILCKTDTSWETRIIQDIDTAAEYLTAVEDEPEHDTTGVMVTRFVNSSVAFDWSVHYTNRKK